MFSGSKSFFRNPTGGGVVTPSDASFSSVPLLLQTTSAVTGKSTTVSDAATPSYAFTASGSPTFGLTSPYQPDGYWSNQFDGSSTLNLATNAIPASGAFTFETFVYVTGTAASQVIAAQYPNGTASGRLMILWNDTANKFTVVLGASNVFVSDATYSVNTWLYLVVQRDASNVWSMYVNGTRNTATVTSATAIDTAVTYIGNRNTGGTPYTGYISNLRVVTSALYSGSTISVPTTPLTAITNTSLLTCQSNRFIDNSTNNYAISASGTPVVSAETPVQSDGYWSNQLPSTSDYLTIAANAAFTLGTQNHTIEFWAYQTSYQQYSTFWAYASATANQNTDSYYLSNGSISSNLLVGAGGGAWGVNIAFTQQTLNVWHHYAITRSGSSWALFIDGVRVGTATFAGSITAQTQPMSIGRASGTTDSFQGYISNLRIVKGTAVYDPAQTTITVPTSPLTVIANTVLLTCQSSSFKDNSTNNFTITRNGSPVTKSVVQPFTSSITSNGAALFNGSSSYLSVTSITAIGTGDFTVETWVYFNSVSADEHIFQLDGAATNFLLSLDATTNKFRFLVRNDSATNNADIYSSMTVVAKQWYHVAGVVSGTTATLYVNGTSAATATLSGSRTATGTTAYIGQNGSSGGRFVNGYLSNSRYVKGVAVYTGNFTPPSNFLTTTGGTYPSTSNVNTSIASTNTSLLANLNNGTYSGSSTLNTVTRNGTPTTGWTSPYQTDGYWSNQFNGTNAYLTTPSSDDFTLGASGSNFTVECWVYATGLQAANAIVLSTFGDFGALAANRWAFAFGTSASNSTLIWYNSTGNASVVTTSFPINSWVHIAAVRNGATITVYVNGTSTFTQTTNQDYSAQGALSAGFVSGAGYFNGYISNARVVKGTAIVPPAGGPTSPLTPVSGTSILTCQSNRFLDTNTQLTPKTITVNGTPSVQSGYYPFAAPTASPGAGLFNGSTDWLTVTPTSSQVLNFGTNPYTIEFWLYGNSKSTNQMLLRSQNATGSLEIYITTAGVITLGVQSVAAYLTIPSANWNISSWNHIAFVRTGTGTNQFFGYVNGVLAATATNAYNHAITGIDVGAGTNYSGGYYLNGYLSNLRVVKGAAVYTGNFTPPTTFLTTNSGTYPSTANVNTSISSSNTSLLLNFSESNYTSASTGVNNNTFVDDSNYAYTVTRNGTPTQGSFTPYWPNGYWSNYFGTNGDYISVPDSANVELGANNFQMDAWIYLTAYPANALGSYFSSIVSKGTFGNSRSYQFGVEGISGTTLGLSLVNASATATSFTGSFSFALNTWYSVRATRVSNRVYLFVNGTLLNTGGTAYTDTVSDSTDILRVGRSNLDVNYVYQFFGYISNVSLAVGGTGYSTASYTPATIPTVATADTKFLSCQSNTFKDNSVNNALVTASGTPSVQAFAPFSTRVAYSPVLHGGSGYFKGSPDYLYTPINTAFTFGTNNFTVEYWLNLSSTSGGRVSCTLGNATTFDPLMGYFATGESTFRVYLSSNNSSWDISNGSTLSYAMNLNSWYHVAIVRNGSNIALYVNGSSVGSITSSASIYQSANDIILGLGQSSFYFPGYISNFRFTRAAVYNASFTLPTAPVSNVTGTNLLLNFTNAAIYDASAQNDITTVGDTQSSTTIFKWAPTSMKFDGTGDYLNVSTGSPQSLTFGTGNFTIEFWVYFTSNTGQQTLYDGRPAAGAYPLLYLNAGVINYYVGGGVAITSVQPSTGVWYFMSLRRSSGITQFFINGTQSGGNYTDSNNYLAPPTSGARIGANYVGGDFLFGYIQDLRISKTARPVTPIPTAAFPTR